MGACSIGFSVDGGKTRDEVLRAFRERQEMDRSDWMCDHDDDDDGEGYTGDFQTVNNIKFTDKVFTDHDAADEYCLDHADKWSYVVAVKVVNDTDPNDPDNYWWVAGWGAE